MIQKQVIVVAIIALLIGASGGYFAAHMLAASTTRGGQNFAGARMGTFMRAGGGTMTPGGGFLTGTVATKNATSMTIDTRDGSSHVVLISPTLSVAKSVAGTLDDVALGSTVIVMGTTNSDGSLSASSLQLRPAGIMPGMAQ